MEEDIPPTRLVHNHSKMSSSINKNVNVERRTWDKETFEARAHSRAAAEAAETNGASTTPLITNAAASSENDTAAAAIKKEIDPTAEKEEFLPAQQGRAGPMGSQRAFLKSRSHKVDLEGKLGSTEIIDPAAASAVKSNLTEDLTAPLTRDSGVTKSTDGVGWHCRVCDCFLKDSLTYLDHINGRKHQRFLGYSMRVEKSTTDEVSGVLQGLAEKKREREGSIGIQGATAATPAAIDFEDVVRKKDEEVLRRRARRREERKRKGKGEANGLGQFNVVAEGRVEEKKVTEEDNPAGEEVEEEEEDGGIDPAFAAMMGFAGFGGSRK
mmetsp:Transcript_8912/g.15736  ORF Transcript_8912/g.15736 Transcript_8912/m.15736 type:complete len:325 (-) Transcript_8912:131-1105(-)